MFASTVFFMIERHDAARIAHNRLVWVQIFEVIRDRIEQGIYKQTYPIPSIPRLKDEFGVADRTVRRALGVLTEQGYLDPISGKGTFVRSEEDWRPADPQGRS